MSTSGIDKSCGDEHLLQPRRHLCLRPCFASFSDSPLRSAASSNWLLPGRRNISPREASWKTAEGPHRSVGRCAKGWPRSSIGSQVRGRRGRPPWLRCSTLALLPRCGLQGHPPNNRTRGKCPRRFADALLDRLASSLTALDRICDRHWRDGGPYYDAKPIDMENERDRQNTKTSPHSGGGGSFSQAFAGN